MTLELVFVPFFYRVLQTFEFFVCFAGTSIRETVMKGEKRSTPKTMPEAQHTQAIDFSAHVILPLIAYLEKINTLCISWMFVNKMALALVANLATVC